MTGIITWPDGVPAGGVTIEFYPAGFPYGGQSGGERIITAANGGYSLSDCPCPALGGLFTLPATGGDWAHGGNQCNIMLVDGDGYLTTSVNRGRELNWSMINMPCARDYILPQNIRQEIADIEADPETLSGGPWQNARDRVF